jgi:uncharacterized protein (DUF58 family)
MLFAALVIYVFATNSQVIWLYLVASLMLGLVVVGLLAPALVVRGVTPRLDGLHRSGFDPPLAQDRGRVFAGDTVSMEFELRQDRAPIVLGPLRVAGKPDQAVKDRPEGSRVVLKTPAGPRGIARYQAILVKSSWPLGIASAERWVELDRTVVVHPKYVLPREDRKRGTREPTGGSSARGAGEEFLGLREYRSGDSQRRIHWPTSARTGTLMVVETAQESSNSTSYELELADSSDAAADLAVGIAASLGAGNVAARVPMAMAIPGQGRGIHRWEEALTALASAQRGNPPSSHGHRDAVRVRAEGSRVSVSRGGEAHVVLDDTSSLADAVTMLDAQA